MMIPAVLICVGIFLFLIGQYNALVMLRHRIATASLEIDFLLQQIGDAMEKQIRSLHDTSIAQDEFSDRIKLIKKARLASHRAAANVFSASALKELADAYSVIVVNYQVLNPLVVIDGGWQGIKDSFCRLEALGNSYRLRIKKFPSTLVVKLF